MLASALVSSGQDPYVKTCIFRDLDRSSADAFVNALVDFLGRLQSFRIAFQWDEAGKLQQTIGPEAVIPVERAYWQVDTPEAFEDAIGRYVEERHRAGIDLYKAPFSRLTLVETANTGIVCIWTYHHIILDGAAEHLLMEGLTAYGLGAEGRSDKPSFLQADAYLNWLDKNRPAFSAEFWRDMLSDYQPSTSLASIALEQRSEAPHHSAASGFEVISRLDEQASADLRLVAASCHVTLNNVLQAAFALSLCAYQDCDDIVVGMIRACRSTVPDGDKILAQMMNIVPFRVSLSPHATLAELFTSVKSVHRSLRDHEHSSLAFIQKAIKAEPRTLLYESVFNFRHRPSYRHRRVVVGCEVDLDWSFVRNTEMPLDCLAFGEPHVSFELRSAPGYFGPEWLNDFATTFKTLLEQIAEGGGEQTVSSLRLTSSEQTQFLRRLNQTDAAYAKDESVIDLFERQVSRSPQSVAVRSGSASVTYDALGGLSARIAQLLAKRGVGQGDVVAVCMRRDINMVASLLGVMQCGAAFVPLDPAYPQSRLAFMLSDSGASVLLCDASTREVFAESALECVDVAKALARNADEDCARVSMSSLGPDDKAYIIYTSGSTGTPKGVVGLHRGLVNRLCWGAARFPFEAGEDCVQKTKLSFVDAIAEIFAPLVNGVPLVLVDDAVQSDPRALLELMGECDVSRIILVPSLLDALLTLGDDLAQVVPRLKLWFVSGELLTPQLARRFAAAVPDATLVNIYGASEVSADSHFHVVEGDYEGPSVPIGQPIANLRGYVLNRHLQEVPPGVSGVLYVAGDGLAQGYWKNDALSEERFIYHGPLGERLFRTGDRVRCLPDGALQYLGREDNQLKIRGMRVEVGEVESALRELAEVQAVAVSGLSRDLGRDPGRSETGGAGVDRDMQLVAYVVGASTLSRHTLRSQLSEVLPAHMVPSHYVMLERLPLLPSGKVDRASLPEVDWDSRAGVEARREAPATELEGQLVAIWQRCLGLSKVGVNDDFFDLGGHSLLAVQVLVDIERELGHRLPVPTLFEAPTVEALALEIEKHKAKQGASDTTSPKTGATHENASHPRLVRLKATGEGPALFVMHAIFGDITYAHNIAVHMNADVPVYGMLPIPLDGVQPVPRALAGIVDDYLAQIRALQPSGPYLLAGYSFGGYLALEIAQRLTGAGERVAFLGIIDTNYDTHTQVAGEQTKARWQRHWRSVWRQNPLTYVGRRVRASLERRAQIVMEHLRQLPNRIRIGRGQALSQEARRVFYRQVFSQAMRHYRPSPYAGEIEFYAREGYAREQEKRWSPIAKGGLTVYELSGDHGAIGRREGGKQLAQRLDEALQRIIANPRDM